MTSGGVSEREAEVLAAVGHHLTNAQIAARLHISVRTVESHVSSLLRKYGAADRKELAAHAGQLAADEVTGLPASRTSFVGRAAEREEITAAFESSRLVTLAGPGGVGKTRLAVAVAEGFGYGGAFVDLVPVRDGFVAEAVAAALGVADRPQQRLEDAIADRLGRGRALLVLDNCEHLLDPVAALVDRLLAVCPGVRVLVTSRERLGVPGERVVPVEPLPPATDAVRLFLDRAAGFDVAHEVAELICARLDGLPLAIELAAARGAALGASGLLAALDDNLRLLAGGRGGDRRHRSLRTVLGWSHDLMEEDERALFRRLAVFAGGFDLDAVVSVAGGSRSAAADVLGRLVDKSLVTHRRDTGGWRLLETVRAFAAERLEESGEGPDVRRRHLSWAIDTADALAAAGAAGWQDRFDAVADDLRAALDEAGAGVAPGTGVRAGVESGTGVRADAEPGTGARVHRLARRFAGLTYRRRFLRESVMRFEQAAALAPSAGEAARDLADAAECALAFARADQAYELQLAAASRARDAGDGNAEAVALARAAVIVKRHPGFGFGDDVPVDRARELPGEASAAGDSSDPYVAAHIAVANAWLAKGPHTTDAGPAERGTDAGPVERAADTGPVERGAGVGPIEGGTSVGPVGRGRGGLAERALGAARATGDPVLTSAALDAVICAADGLGREREAYRLAKERLTLLPAMDRDDPRSGIEIVDSLHTASFYAIAVGDLPGALEAARMAAGDDVTGSHPALAMSRLVPPLVLAGDFGEALARADEMWAGQARMDGAPGRWMAPALGMVALAHGLLGDDEAFHAWRSRAIAVGHIGPGSRYASLITFIDARLAIHRIDSATSREEATRTAGPGFGPERAEPAALVVETAQPPEGGLFWRYAVAAVAELAVVRGEPAAAERLAAAQDAGVENAWAAACLQRAGGRSRGDREALAEAARMWERIGAVSEREATLNLTDRSG